MYAKPMQARSIRYELIDVPHCDMCGSGDRRQLGLRLGCSTGLRPHKASAAAIPVKECLACGLIYSDPLPLPLNVEDHYGLDAETYFPFAHVHEPPPFDNRRLERLMDVRPGMKVIDVGAGIGTNLIAFRKAGWDAWGIEPSASFVRFGIENLGLDAGQLLQQSFEDTDLPDDSFDLVWFGAVLEHLRSPSAALRTACRILKPGGIIMAEIPSSRAILPRLINLYYRLLGTSYVTNISPLHPPFHLYEFTHRSFVANGRRVGYELARHFYWQPELYNVPKALQSIIRAALEKTGRGDGLTVFLRKV